MELEVHDDKYIVFKREDMKDLLLSQEIGEISLPTPVDDAVVIRRQDYFSPPALAVYHNGISVALEIARPAPDDELGEARIKRLREIRDYFHRQELAAWDTHRKLPD